MADETPSDSDTDNVVDLPIKPTELRPTQTSTLYLAVDRTRGKFCMHDSILVCEKQREVECAHCGAQLFAFDALLKIAQDHERWNSDSRHLKTEIHAARHRLEMLKRLEANARARCKKHGVRTNRNRLDTVIAAIRRIEANAAKVDDQTIEYQLEWLSPEGLIGGAQKLLERGEAAAAVELLRQATDELEAALYAKEQVSNA
jgi:hypothetical protein